MSHQHEDIQHPQADRNPPSAVLEFQRVTRRAEGRLLLDDVSFRLNRGELLLIGLEEGAEDIGISDVAIGLEQPDLGYVRFGQTEWKPRSSAGDEHRRSAIGRVFRGNGWIANLDVIENVTLAQRHHSGRTVEDLMPAIDQWTTLAGLDEIPPGRPAAVPSAELLRCAQWVRAFYAEPALVILEEPMADVSDRRLQTLIQMVARARSDGTAVLWLTSDPRVLFHRSLLDVPRCRMSGPRLLAGEESSL